MIYKTRTLKQLSESKDVDLASKAKQCIKDGFPEFAIFEVKLEQVIIYQVNKMNIIRLSPLPETKFEGIALYPEDASDEWFLKKEVEHIKELIEMRKFLNKNKDLNEH